MFASDLAGAPIFGAAFLVLAVLGCRPAGSGLSAQPAATQDGSGPSTAPATASPEAPSPLEGSTQPDAAITIAVWQDFTCPWCRIGLTNLETAIDALPPATVEVVYHPYLLDPSVPAEGADLRERLGARYGADRIEGMFARVTEAGAVYGIPFAFDNVRLTPSTVPAHTLLAWAPPESRDALIHELHVAYFERGENVGDPAVLGALAANAGLDAAAATAAAFDATAQAAVRTAASTAPGIRGVPHIVIGGTALQGAQSPEAYAAAIADAAARR
jgi:predicted DsbA family dithiol-disulfide isomerase